MAGNSQCLKQERFKTVLAVKEFLRGRSFLKPIYVLPKNRHVEIMNEKWDDTLGQMTLSIRYLDHKDRRVTDELTYQMNFGKNRIAKGCATLIRNPEYFVMSEECLDSGKKKPGRGISSESGH